MQPIILVWQAHVSQKSITSFQTNQHQLVLEFVGQTITRKWQTYLDVVSWFITSQARVDLGYRHELSSMTRSAPKRRLF
jgi:hypothetical protein